MAGLGLADLPLPRRRFDPLGTPRFETYEACAFEDRLVRSPALLELARNPLPYVDARAARRLGRQLGGIEVPDTLGSSPQVYGSPSPDDGCGLGPDPEPWE